MRCSSAPFLATRGVWECKSKHPKKQFSVKVGTIFEDSPIGLDKWLAAIWMIANDKNGISSYEVARGIGVTQKSAWFMLHHIRLAMQTGTFQKLAGEVEVDEMFIGGKAKNMHKHIWTTQLLADYLEGHTGIAVDQETVRRHLHRLGYVCKRPVWVVAHKAHEQPDYVGKGSGGRSS